MGGKYLYTEGAVCGGKKKGQINVCLGLEKRAAGEEEKQEPGLKGTKPKSA